MPDSIAIGDRVEFWYFGTHYWGRVLKINRTSYKISDEKWGSTDTYRVAKERCTKINLPETQHATS